MQEKNFLAGLKSYLQKYKYSNAATNDLWHSLSQVQYVTDVIIRELDSDKIIRELHITLIAP
jgi:SPX domain protein involved in polyphosphate accumulation